MTHKQMYSRKCTRSSI